MVVMHVVSSGGKDQHDAVHPEKVCEVQTLINAWPKSARSNGSKCDERTVGSHTVYHVWFAAAAIFRWRPQYMALDYLLRFLDATAFSMKTTLKPFFAGPDLLGLRR